LLIDSKRIQTDDYKVFYVIKLKNELEQHSKSNNEQDEIRKLAIYLQNAREEERSKIARELHDELGQYLTILKMDLQSILSNENISQDKLSSKILNSLAILDKAISVTRKIITELRLAILDHLGLVPALEHLIDEFKNRTNIEIDFDLDKSVNIRNETAIHLFRICQELFTNIIKHSKATKAELILKKVHNDLLIQISDNGIGFDVSELKSKDAFGLIGIRERIYILNGQFDLISIPGKGTTVKIKVPIKNENSNS